MSTVLPSESNTPTLPVSVPVIRDPRIIRRVEIMCELFEMAYEIKSLELRRRNVGASENWIRSETLRLIAAESQ